MILVDAHQDIAYNYLQHGRDYRRSAWETRRLEARTATATEAGLAANGLPNALLGRIAVIFATLFAEPEWSTFTLNKRCGYATPEQAYQVALRQWEYYQRLADEAEQIDLVRTQAELEAVLDTWEEGVPMQQHRVGLVLLMEGADPILEPRQVEEWVERGVRIIGPAWSETRYAGGTGRPGPLTDLGRELLAAMADFNLVLDLTHTTEEGYLEALDRYPGPIIASHSNPTACWDNHRNLTDLQIERLAERDGVIGVVFYSRFLDADWYRGAPKHVTPFGKLLAAIDHICQVTGSARHVGLGSDVDGGFGAEAMPVGIDTVADFLQIGDGLRGMGYQEEDIAAILGQNFLRVLRQSLP